MKASETKLQKVIEGTVQYVIPLFQRTYSWDKKEWEVLWEDILELYHMENPRAHFIGSIVSMPTVSVPEGVAKYLLIDGQQRLTTIFILLTLLRDSAKEDGNPNLADEIHECFLVNKFKGGQDYFKLMPTQMDRNIFINLIGEKQNEKESQISRAYDFFKRKLKQKQLNTEILKKVITTSFSIVSIVLDADDNPYLVFESLNAKGRPLTQADLIRNFFFMRIHIDNQEEVYSQYWQPMQEALRENLTEYIRHYLMRDGIIVKQTDVYYSLKEKITPLNAISYLKELNKFSQYYQKLIYPDFEKDIDISKYLKRLNRIEVTTAYPLLLNCYDYYSCGKISSKEFVAILKILENYLIRRFVCGIPTSPLNRIFPSIFAQIASKEHQAFVEQLKIALQSKGYPKDPEFRLRFKEAKMYGAGDRAVKTKLILETLEEHYAHKELVPFKNLTIEHIMPQTLSPWWQNYLGENWEDIHELYLHIVGNLTLTAYNSELSNDNFPIKCKTLCESHLELNRYFCDKTKWDKEAIELRSEYLAGKALEIWSYFGHENTVNTDIGDVTGTTPKSLMILGQNFTVSTWRDVMEMTFNTIADLEPDKFDAIAQNYSRYVGRDKSKFRAIRELKNKYFIEVNLSAKDIQKLCNQAIETIELTSDDWKVTI